MPTRERLPTPTDQPPRNIISRFLFGNPARGCQREQLALRAPHLSALTVLPACRTSFEGQEVQRRVGLRSLSRNPLTVFLASGIEFPALPQISGFGMLVGPPPLSLARRSKPLSRVAIQVSVPSFPFARSLWRTGGEANCIPNETMNVASGF